jgi:hypothetical protein
LAEDPSIRAGSRSSAFTGRWPRSGAAPYVQDEARIAVRLDHPNLVRAFASSTEAIAPAGGFTRR